MDGIRLQSPRPHSHDLSQTIIQLTAKRDNELADIQMSFGEREITVNQRLERSDDVNAKWRADVAQTCEAFLGSLEDLLAAHNRLAADKLNVLLPPPFIASDHLL